MNEGRKEGTYRIWDSREVVATTDFAAHFEFLLGKLENLQSKMSHVTHA